MRLAVLTSGGDAPGMNPALRGVVREALHRGAEVVGVSEGYAGLVTGGDHLRPLRSRDVSRILARGGTVLGTARSAAFRTLDGRRRAVARLVSAGLDRLVVIGGDGSLTGAGVLVSEWSSHLSALVEAGELDPAVAEAHPHLHLVGLAGSIDNDLVGTDRTIGFDTALHRIVDAVDALSSTARSHQRSFVVEVMGRRCGHLALAAAVCTDADVVLLPEAPPTDWRTTVTEALKRGRERGRRRSLVLLAEGATDRDGTPIAPREVRAHIEATLQVDTRITVLGHVQRGGAPSALDRVVSGRLGARAAELALGPDPSPVLVGTDGRELVVRPLLDCLDATTSVGAAIDARAFDQALAARGPEFADLLRVHRSLDAPHPPAERRLLVAHVGAPAPGMNAALATLARLGPTRGRTVLAAHEGLRGLSEGRVHPLDDDTVEGIVGEGSTVIGTNRWLPEGPEEREGVRRILDAERVDEIVLIGGFEALEAARRLADLGRPVAVVPATISNNVPGTDRSVGADTAVNVICHAVDGLALSAIGARDRVFFVEVMGRRCGWLAETAGAGSGAELVYTHEEGVDLERVRTDVRRLRSEFDAGRTVGIALVADGVPTPWDTATLARVFASESDGRFDTRVCMLGHTQQGGRPAPADRLAGALLADGALAWLTASAPGKAAVVGLRGGLATAHPLHEVLDAADPTHRRPR